MECFKHGGFWTITPSFLQLNLLMGTKTQRALLQIEKTHIALKS